MAALLPPAPSEEALNAEILRVMGPVRGKIQSSAQRLSVTSFFDNRQLKVSDGFLWDRSTRELASLIGSEVAWVDWKEGERVSGISSPPTPKAST